MTQDNDGPTIEPEVEASLPTLSVDVVEDDEQLSVLVDAVIFADPAARDRAEQIVMHQGWLRSIVDADVWRLYAEVESRQDERWSELTLTLTRWAFGEGRRHPHTKNGGAP